VQNTFNTTLHEKIHRNLNVGTSLANQVAYLKQTNARKNLYQGNVLQQHKNVEVPHPVGIECSITVPMVKYHKIFQNIHIHIHDHHLFKKPQRSKYVIKQEAAVMTFSHHRIPYTNTMIYAVTCLKKEINRKQSTLLLIPP
jgi:hypothetical protein